MAGNTTVIIMVCVLVTFVLGIVYGATYFLDKAVDSNAR